MIAMIPQMTANVAELGSAWSKQAARPLPLPAGMTPMGSDRKTAKASAR